MSFYVHERSINRTFRLFVACQLRMCMCVHVNMDGTWSERAASAIFGRVTRCEERAKVKRNLRIVSGIERRNTAFTFVACPSVTHPLNGDLVILCFEQRERERERERDSEGQKERGREERYLRICQFR